MASRFNPLKADAHWQKAWDDRPKAYILEMFPYPSGRIHMGHVRNYTMGDVLARYRRMNGFEVLHPMGWDAFGMPAENAAMERKVHPGEWTWSNIATMRGAAEAARLRARLEPRARHLRSRLLRHEQALFLDLFDAGLVYRKESEVNWDPVDMTVLANEQVIDGRGWRSGALVERRKLNQWFLKITDFAEELLLGAGSLDQWPDKVRLMQENWIGKSRGLRFRFARRAPIAASTASRCSPPGPTRSSARASPRDRARPSAGAGAGRARSRRRLHRRVQAGRHHRRRARDGREEGLRHRPGGRPPARPEWKLPVYIANFVLMDYGTGAIFGCPAHDQRDLDFATANTACRSAASSRPRPRRPMPRSGTRPIAATA
jgi:leucyl-tRNA synthetase